ncbi:MAG TPA: DUF5606 domain-containing protein [Bacteroidales bacterium]|jgi:hypothetical protein|nr:DUF5606 domain-containing protein [Bacteroidales bacterium]
MNLKDIMAISGQSGLFRFLAQGRNGVIVEGLVDKKRINASATSRISALEDIAVYTEEKEMPLVEVFRIIFTKENGAPIKLAKNTDDLVKKYFGEILPTYDKDRVYVSDMKKVINWYNILQGQNLVDLVVEEKKEEETKKEEAAE